jgi:hypothetical protein
MSRTKNVPYVKLSQDDWKDIKDTATTISGYDPENSAIKGMTTIDLMKQIRDVLTEATSEVAQGNTMNATDLIGEAFTKATLLMRREAYNRVIGEQKRDKMASAAQQQATSA